MSCWYVHQHHPRRIRPGRQLERAGGLTEVPDPLVQILLEEDFYQG